jgi:hypothetical protein
MEEPDMHPNRYVARMPAMGLLLAPLAQAVELMAQTTASTDAQQVTEVGKWLEQKKSLRGTRLQDAAGQKGVDAGFVAMVLYADVHTPIGKDKKWKTEAPDLIPAASRASLCGCATIGQ